MAVIIKDMKMPQCCGDCPFLDDNGDYPFCLVNCKSRGYTFNIRENRMPTCPLTEPFERKNDDFVLFTCSKCGRKYGMDGLTKHLDEEWGFNYYVSECPDCGEHNEINDCYWR